MMNELKKQQFSLYTAWKETQEVRDKLSEIIQSEEDEEGKSEK